MVSSNMHLNNHPIYSIDTNIKSSIFYNDLSFEEEDPTIIMIVEDKVAWQEKECLDPRIHAENELWNMRFDGSIIKGGVGAGVWICPPNASTKLWSYKLSFDYTNNMAEYEALILGLRVFKELSSKRNMDILIFL
jgi:hypothetical protein